MYVDLYDKERISKAELTDIELLELSLVNKAANKKKFLFFKSEESGEVNFEKFIEIYPVEKADTDEHIISGIVYEPMVKDTDGDFATENEIRKAAFHFMQNIQRFRVNHKGDDAKVKVLESYIAPVDLVINKQSVKKGSWVLTARILSKKLWTAIKNGDINSFSMAGQAMKKSDEDDFPSLAMTQGGDLLDAKDYEFTEEDEGDEE